MRLPGPTNPTVETLLALPCTWPLMLWLPGLLRLVVTVWVGEEGDTADGVDSMIVFPSWWGYADDVDILCVADGLVATMCLCTLVHALCTVVIFSVMYCECLPLCRFDIEKV